MGELIGFRPRSGRISQAESPAGATGRLLLFTGVRYERWEEPAPEGDADPNPAEGLGKSGRNRKRRRV